MNTYSTPTWGYKIVSDHQINFYHILLPKIDIQNLSQKIPYIQNISSQKDGSINISIKSAINPQSIVDAVAHFFTKKEQGFLETPIFHYKVEEGLRQTLLPWALSFQGCLALLLLTHPTTAKIIDPNWQYINAPTGGLYLSPFTLFLYTDHPKIIHPVGVGNFQSRKDIEQGTSLLIRKMIKIMTQAQPGHEGLALLSLVQDAAKLSSKEICRIINDKSFGIKQPIHSPFFTG